MCPILPRAIEPSGAVTTLVPSFKKGEKKGRNDLKKRERREK